MFYFISYLNNDKFKSVRLGYSYLGECMVIMVIMGNVSKLLCLKDFLKNVLLNLNKLVKEGNKAKN